MTSNKNYFESIKATPEEQADYAEQSKETFEDTISRIVKLSLIEYDRIRVEVAKNLACRPVTLDALVKAARSEEKNKKRLPFDEVEPFYKEINPALLLDEIAETIKKYIVLDDQQAYAAALWIMHTWLIDVLEISPLLIIDAPEKSCGKTQLLTMVGRMCYRPLPASNASISAIFRAVEQWRPTILIDEADTFFRDNHELHGMVNAGYSRDGFILRSEAVGDSFEPRSFSVFSPKAIAGIALGKHLPDSTMSRGIVLNLRRKLPHESVARLRHADRNLFIIITQKLARFAKDYSKQVKEARHDLPGVLSDRQQDNWDGLFAIATCVGEECIKRTNDAALKLSICANTVSIGNDLLSDIQEIFDTKRIPEIFTVDLLSALINEEEKIWATYNRGRPLTFNQLAKKLEPYGIEPKPLRIGGEQRRGYKLKQFSDAFERYLAPPIYPSQCHKSLKAFTDNNLSVTENATANKDECRIVPNIAKLPIEGVTPALACDTVTASQFNSVTPNPLPVIACDTVTGKDPYSKKFIRI